MGKPIPVELAEELQATENDRSIEDDYSERHGKLKKLLKDIDPWTAWAYKPHTATVLVLGSCFLV
jgi:hypothetical protein